VIEGIVGAKLDDRFLGDRRSVKRGWAFCSRPTPRRVAEDNRPDGTVEEVGQRIFELIRRVASGERTKSELLGHKEFVPWRVGPVL
jgi:hypothetical protein